MDFTLYTQLYQTNGRAITNKRYVGDLQAGLPDAWTHTYLVYQNWLMGIARKMGLRLEEAQDMVQLTFISVAKHVAEFKYERAKGRFSGWLVTVLMRNIFNLSDTKKRDPLSHVTLPLEGETEKDPIEELPGPTENEVITQVFINELEEIAAKSCAELKDRVSKKHWQVFEACVLNELTPEEAGEPFGMNRDSIYPICSRMRKQLRKIKDRELEGARK